MEKDRFLNVAPKYYALAAALHFFNNNVSQDTSISREYVRKDNFDGSSIYYLRHKPLLDAGIIFLKDLGYIDIMEDDFGPKIMVRSENFIDIWNSLTEIGEEPFRKYQRLGNGGQAWLLSALHGVNAKYDELNITDEDFLEPDHDWAPIALDRRNPIVSEAINDLSVAIELIEQDNGYAAHLPEERSFVLGALKNTFERLKKDSHTSIAYLRRNAIEPLSTIVKRFGKAAVGVAATVAGLAIIKLLENAETTALTTLLKSYFQIH